MEVIGETTGDGMTHGTIITITAVGISHHTTIADRHTSQEAQPEDTPTDIMDVVHVPNPMDRYPATVQQASHQRLPDQVLALAEEA